MPWFKTSDKLHGQPEIADAGVEAMGLWGIAGSWCSDYLTDGHIPRAQVRKLAPPQQFPDGGVSTDAEVLASRLVQAGLWVETPTGWRFATWAPDQPTKEQVLAERASKQEAKVRAGQLGGIKSGEARRAAAAAKQNEAGASPVKHGASGLLPKHEAQSQAQAKQNEPPIPYPFPESERNLSEGLEPLEPHGLTATHTGFELSPEATVIRDEIRSHRVFARVDADRQAEVCEGLRGASGKLLPWVIAAIRELAADASPDWDADFLRRKFRTYTSNARAPRQQSGPELAGGRPPPSHEQLVADEADRLYPPDSPSHPRNAAGQKVLSLAEAQAAREKLTKALAGSKG